KQAETAAALSALKSKKWETKPLKSEPEPTSSAPVEPEIELEVKPTAAKRARKRPESDEPRSAPS
ncbi:MAG TPA: hypothetical protein VI114_02245, partial [Chthoniobacterales bacterium]